MESGLPFDVKHAVRTKGYCTDVITDKCIDWMEQTDKNKPFFLMCHFKAPHTPFTPAERHKDLYKGVVFPEPDNLYENLDSRPILKSVHNKISGGRFANKELPKEDRVKDAYQEYIRTYLSCIAGIDENVGRLLDYLENIGKQSAEQGSRNYARTVLNTVRALKLFRGDYIAFRDVDKEFLSEFTDYLRQMPKASKYGVLKTGGRLSANSVVSYYGTLRTAINRAYKEGIITVNPTKEFDFASKVRQEPSRREYLTIDELKTLINTECRHEIVKRAFLFSCLCGLRVSDIRKLRWCDLQRSGGRVRIEITMQKTKEPLYLPISDEALKWLPERGEANDSDYIFPLTHEGTVNDTLQHWAKVAGITKHISFHIWRHPSSTF